MRLLLMVGVFLLCINSAASTGDIAPVNSVNDVLLVDNGRREDLKSLLKGCLDKCGSFLNAVFQNNISGFWSEITVN